MTTGQKIYELRKSARITQEQFAEKLEVSRQAVSKWESDTAYPETDKIIKIAELFGVSCDYLLKDGVEAAEGRLSPPRRALFKMLVTIGVACCAVGYVVAIICYYCIDMRESPLIGLGVLVAFLLAALILWQAGRYRFLNGCDYTEADKSHLAKMAKAWYYASIIALFCYLPSVALYDIINVLNVDMVQGGHGDTVLHIDYVPRRMMAVEFILTFISYGGVGCAFARLAEMLYNFRFASRATKTDMADCVIVLIISAFASACLTVGIYWLDGEANGLTEITDFKFYTGIMVSFGTIFPAAIATHTIVHKIYDRTPTPLFALQLCACALYVAVVPLVCSPWYIAALITGASFAVAVAALIVLSIAYAVRKVRGIGMLRMCLPIYFAAAVQLIYSGVTHWSTDALVAVICLSVLAFSVPVLHLTGFTNGRKPMVDTNK